MKLRDSRKLVVVLVFLTCCFSISIGLKINEHYKIVGKAAELKEVQEACIELRDRSTNQMSPINKDMLKKDYNPEEIGLLTNVRDDLSVTVNSLSSDKYANTAMLQETESIFTAASFEVDRMLNAFELLETINGVFEEPIIQGDEISPNINQIDINEDLNKNQIERLAKAISKRKPNSNSLEEPMQVLADTFTDRLTSIGTPTDILENIFMGGENQAETEEQLAKIMIQLNEGSENLLKESLRREQRND